MSAGISRQQSNRRIGIGLAVFAAAVFLSYVLRQWTGGA